MRLGSALAAKAAIVGLCSTLWLQASDPKSIGAAISTLRRLDDHARPGATKDLALQIRALPAGTDKTRLATNLAMISTEGDPGHSVLQEVATTLSESLNERPPEGRQGEPAPGYQILAQLVRYENVRIANDSPQFAAAMASLEAMDHKRQRAGFHLRDLSGSPWSLDQLRGKVVLVNFWATWCPPCRKEMPDLEALYRRFQSQGLVVLGISDEEAGKVKPFARTNGLTFPVLLDPGRKAHDAFVVDGIPKTFIFNRTGKLVAQAMDMRTMDQFLRLLAQAGLE